jgi:hypothetical protein
MKEDGEEKKKKSWRGRGRSNEWMTDATDRSPLTEQTRRGIARLPGPQMQLSLLFPTVAARPVPSQPFRFHTPGKAGRVTIFVCPSPLGSSRSANKSFPSRHSSGYYYCLGASLENVLPNYSGEMNITIIYYVKVGGNIPRFGGVVMML